MDWLAGIFGSIMGTAASGGIFGLVGSLLGSIFTYFQLKQEHEQKKEMIRLQMEVRQQEGSWKGLEASLVAESSIGRNYLWVNAIRALFRPVLTVLLVVVVVLIFYALLDAFSNLTSALATLFTAAEIKEMIEYIIKSMVFSACTAIVWWFGDRAFQPPGLKNR